MKIGMKLQMVDLQGQYQRIKNEIDASIKNVIESAAFINGTSLGRIHGSETRDSLR